jgi:hypothetical protein
VVLNLGAGVQSSTLLLMAAAGEVTPMPDLAIFADTGWEPKAVYAQLDWLEAEVAGTIPIVRVGAGNLRDDLVAFAAGEGRRYASPPLFVSGPAPAPCMGCGGAGREVAMFAELPAEAELLDAPVCKRCGGSGDDPEVFEEVGGLLRRQCTREYKIEPAERELRRRGFGGRGERAVRVEQWIGISLDEVERMKPSRRPWIETRWPLVELRMTRADCVRWFRRRYPRRKLVSSSCVGCPYHSDAHWRRLRYNRAEWAEAVEVDRAVRHLPSLRGSAFLHRSCKPLEEVDLATSEDRGQLGLLGAEDFSVECDGYCGT